MHQEFVSPQHPAGRRPRGPRKGFGLPRASHAATGRLSSYGVKSATVKQTVVSSLSPASPAKPWPVAARHRLRWPLILSRVLLDAILVLLAFTVAYAARYEWEILRDLAAPDSYRPLSAFWPM